LRGKKGSETVEKDRAKSLQGGSAEGWGGRVSPPSWEGTDLPKRIAPGGGLRAQESATSRRRTHSKSKKRSDSRGIFITTTNPYNKVVTERKSKEEFADVPARIAAKLQNLARKNKRDQGQSLITWGGKRTKARPKEHNKEGGAT